CGRQTPRHLCAGPGPGAGRAALAGPAAARRGGEVAMRATTDCIARLALAAVLLVFAVSPARAITITIVNNDGPGEGFNDPTAAAPVGRNNGTTVGQQRLNCFQEAANIWSGLLPGPGVVQISAQFDPLSCTATSAVLGSAGPVW